MHPAWLTMNKAAGVEHGRVEAMISLKPGSVAMRPDANGHRAAIKELQSELRLLAGTIDSLREEAASQSVAVGEKVHEIHRLWDVVDEGKATSEQFIRLNQAARKRIEELEAALADARANEIRAEQVALRLKQVEGSLSWTLTAPLRHVSNFLRGRENASRHSHRSLLEQMYRALPLPFAKKVKAAIFTATGKLFSRTVAYQRWQAEVSTRGPLQPMQATPPLALIERAQSQTSVLVNEVWTADGRLEWADYPSVRASIDAGLAPAAEHLAPKPLPMTDFSDVPPAKAAATINLPAPPALPDVTILVPAFNHLATTLECLASIAAHADPAGPTFEVIVANDASTDDTEKVLGSVANLRMVTQPANLGFLRNCNSAAGSPAAITWCCSTTMCRSAAAGWAQCSTALPPTRAFPRSDRRSAIRPGGSRRQEPP